MPKSTKISKIQFNRIRQSKSDYVKHFINQRLGTASAVALSFGLGAMLILNLGVASAQPSSTPPGGAVNARFDSVRTQVLSHPNGACGTYGCPPELSINFLNGIFANYGIVTTGLQANELDLRNSISNRGTTNSGNVKIDDGVIMTGNLSITGTITNPTSGSRLRINNEIDARGGISNQGTGAKVLINDELQVEQNIDVRGYITNNAIISGTGQPLAIEDDVAIAGNVNITGGGRLNVYGEFGNFIKVDGTRNNMSSGFEIAGTSCPSGYKIMSCSGIMTNRADYDYLGTTSPGSTQDCLATAGKRTTSATTTMSLTAQAVCFRPY